MKKRMNRMVIILSATIMVFVCSFFVNAETVESGYCNKDLSVTWTLDDSGLLTISGEGLCSGITNITNKDDVKKVEITDGITALSDSVFASYKNLTYVELPDTLTSIGENTFMSCVSLKDVFIPKSVTSINAHQETWTTFGQTIISTYSPFFCCNSDLKIYCEDQAQKTGWKNYWNYYNTNTYYTPLMGVSRDDYKLLRTLDLSEKNVVIPNGVKIIPNCFFWKCENIENVVIPEGVENIGNSAFVGCTKLTNIFIPNSVSSIGETIFSGADSSLQIYCEANNNQSGCDSDWNAHYVDGKPVCYTTYYNVSRDDYNLLKSVDKAATEIEIPSGVSRIPAEYFMNCNIKSLSIPDSLLGIEDYAFYNCKYLENVVIPKSVTYVGKYAFSNCNKLESVVIVGNKITIDSYTFSGCTRLSSVDLSDDVLAIGENAFESCSGIKELHLESIYGYLNIEYGNTLSHPLSKTSQNVDLYINDEAVTKLVIPGDVGIGPYSFRRCSGLTDIVLSDGITYIGGEAFSYCRNIKDIYIPDSVGAFSLATDTILDYPFYGCNENLIIFCGGSSTVLNKWNSTWNCYGIERVKNKLLLQVYYDVSRSDFELLRTIDKTGAYVCIPEGLTCIPSKFFANMTECASLEISDSVKEIKSNAFEGCTAIKKLLIHNVDNYLNIKYSNEKSHPLAETKMNVEIAVDGDIMSSINVSDNVSEIGDYAFYKCINIENIVISSKVKKIGKYSFGGCTNIKRIVVEGDTMIDACSFDKYGGQATVYARKDSYATYSSLLPRHELVYLDNYETKITDEYCAFASKQIAIKKGDVIKVTDIVRSNYDYEIDSSDDSVVIIDNGMIAAVETGECQITLTTDKQQDNTTVIVVTDDCESVDKMKFEHNTITVQPGEYAVNPIDFDPYYSLQDIVYTVEDEDIAECSNGVIIPKKIGKTKLTAALKSDSSISATCEISVENIFEKIVLLDKSINLEKGKSEQIQFITIPSNITFMPNVEFESDDESIASITSNGVVTAISNGTTDIVIRINQIEYKISVSVYTPIYGLSFENDTIQIKCGKTEQLNLVYNPNDTSQKEIVWTTNNSKAAIVDEQGSVKGVSSGIATIKATSKENCNIFAECNVVVSHDWESEKTVDIVPTCTEAGSKSTHCSGCDATKDSEVVLPAHCYCDVEYKPATISASGFTAYKECSVCHEILGKEAIPQIDPNSIMLDTPEGDYVWDGEAKTPSVTVKDIEGAELINGKDFDVEYFNNVDAGIATVNIKFKGNYDGVVEKNFNILGKSVAEFGFVLDQNEFIFDGIDKSPNIEIRNENGEPLIKDTDYTIRFEDNTKPGKAKMIINFSDNYGGGEVVKEFDIICEHKSVKHIEAKYSDCTNAGNSEYWICEDCGKYFAEATCDTEIAEGSWIIGPKGHKTNAKVTAATFTADGCIEDICSECGNTIASTPIKKPVATLSKTAYTYNGKAQTPTVSIEGLKNGTDYSITWSLGRKNVGKYSAKITLKGKYSGNKTLSYKINPKKATIKTPAKSKTYVTVKWSKQSGKMSTKRITGYQVQIAKDKKFTKSLKSYKVKGYKKTSKKITKLKRKTQYYVRVRTYLGSYYSDWSSVKAVKTK